MGTGRVSETNSIKREIGQNTKNKKTDPGMDHGLNVQQQKEADIW